MSKKQTEPAEIAEHTPGPWYWTDRYKARDRSDTWSLVGPTGYGILSCDGESNSPQEINPANARLIAAAPDMLVALQQLRDAFIGNSIEVQADAMRNARAAIAKATGGEV